MVQGTSSGSERGSTPWWLAGRGPESKLMIRSSCLSAGRLYPPAHHEQLVWTRVDVQAGALQGKVRWHAEILCRQSSATFGAVVLVVFGGDSTWSWNPLRLASRAEKFMAQRIRSGAADPSPRKAGTSRRRKTCHIFPCCG